MGAWNEYPAEVRAVALERFRAGERRESIAADLGMAPSRVFVWAQQAAYDLGPHQVVGGPHCSRCGFGPAARVHRKAFE